MAVRPTAYTQGTDFSGAQAASGDSGINGADLDAELAAIANHTSDVEGAMNALLHSDSFSAEAPVSGAPVLNQDILIELNGSKVSVGNIAATVDGQLNAADAAAAAAQAAQTAAETAQAAAEAAEAGAAADATSASTSASSADASATAAAGSATAAATSATTASDAATAAGTSESNAAGSESNADLARLDAQALAQQATGNVVLQDGTNTGNVSAYKSALDASTSAGQAAASASNAGTYAAQAEAALEGVEARYLGSYASAPALDPNGNALIDGALYYNSTNDTLYSYNLSGTAWEAASGPKGDPGTGLDFANPGGPIQELNGVVTFYLADATSYSTGDLTGPTGATGAQGPQGDTGADGSTVLNGTVAPTTEGVFGDFYVRTDTNEIYGPKTGAGWGSPTSLVGPTGPAGADGSDATVTTQAVDGVGAVMDGDFSDGNILVGTATPGTYATKAAPSGEIGEKGIPSAGAAKTGVHSLQTSDNGNHILLGTGGSITVPTGLTAGQTFSVVETVGGTPSISFAAGVTARMAGNATDLNGSSATLAAYGVATILMVGTSSCVIVGNVS